MKNTAIVATFTIFTLLSTFTFAQNWEAQKPFKETYIYGCDPTEETDRNKPTCGVIIALRGLKLRSNPSFDARTLATIPFGSTVQRTEKGYDLRPDEWLDRLMTPDSIRGYWQEIIWNGKKGYAFSAFIGDAIHRMSNDSYLLMEGDGFCQNDCYASPSYHYYGVFPNRDSSRWDLKKIKPSFIYQDISFTGTAVRSDSKQRPAFMLAMKKPLKEGLILTEKKNEVELIFKGYYDLKKIGINKKVSIPLSQFALSVTEQQKQEDERRNCDILLTEKITGRRQVLMTGFHLNEIQLVWSGDLDSDGIMDFMLSYTGDHFYGYQLFLSSLAKGKQLVKPIKIYWFEDCC